MPILFVNVNISGFMKTGMTLLHTEMPVTMSDIWKNLLNIQDFISVRLPTHGMMELPSVNAHRLNTLLKSQLLK